MLPEVITLDGKPRFEIERRLGVGGHGAVYAAWDRALRARIALKHLLRMDPRALTRFKREFRAQAELRHPNVVALRELFESGGEWFISMELVPGESIVRYVRGPQNDLCDHGRLRDAASQLVAALSAVHRSGRLHRDVKPENVLVTPTGRAVLLDFGLVTERDHDEESASPEMVGTLPYMAPEQAEGTTLGPAADWYAFGALLYHCLTGNPPFEGEGYAALVKKLTEAPPRPSDASEGVPPDLDELSVALLSPGPEARPGPEALLEVLGSEGATAPPSGHAGTEAERFVGRRGELERMAALLERAERGASGALALLGESGVGKSALLRRFEADTRGARPEAWILFGRSFPREHVPYAAFDAMIDTLARRLRRLPEAEVAPMVPAGSDALLRLFPVLGTVPAMASTRAPAGPRDPRRERRRGFSALRALLESIAERRPLMLILDDVHWAGEESLSLMRALYAEGAPKGVATILAGRRDEARAAEILDRFCDVTSAERLSLGGLGVDESRALFVEREGGKERIDEKEVETLIAESGGHPLFLDALIHARSAGRSSAESLRIEDAIRLRTELLFPHERELLALVCLAEAPLPEGVLAEASKRPVEAVGRSVHRLSELDLVRLSRALSIDVYHDRIRHAVAPTLPPDERRGLHRALAEAFTRWDRPDPEVLMTHWLGAAELETAAAYAEEAARGARAALAFDRAADLLSRALEWDPKSERKGLRLERRADALVAAGRSREAGESYLEAASHASGREGRRLRSAAAEQLLKAGAVDRGIALAEEVLEEIGERLPRTPRRALLSLGIRRARLRLANPMARRDPLTSSPEVLERIDLLSGLGYAMSMSDPFRGLDVQTRALLAALEAGEPSRLARALAVEVVRTSSMDRQGVERSGRILELARSYAEKVESPYLSGLLRMAEGFIFYYRRDLEACRRAMAEAEAIFDRQCPGIVWELTHVRYFGLSATRMMGDFPHMRAWVLPPLREAAERGDLYAETHLTCVAGSTVALLDDDSEEAERMLDAVMSRWPQDRYLLQHYFALLAHVRVDLYRGGRRGLERLDAETPAIARSALRHARMARVNLSAVRIRCLTVAALDARPDERRALQEEALSIAKALSRQNAAEAGYYASQARAAILADRGRLGEALEALDRAEAAGRRSQLDLAPLEIFRGMLVGGEEGKELERRAEASLRERGVREPRRWLGWAMPGIPDQG